MSDSAHPRPTDGGAVRTLGMAWLHLAVLWAFAVAQPLFNILDDDPAFFVARGNTTGDIVLLAFGLVLVPPTVLVAVEAVFVRLPVVREWLHVVFVALLASVFALQLIGDAAPGGSSAFLIPLSLLCGAAVGLAYRRTRFVPSMLSVLSPAPVLFLAFFLLFSDVSKLVLPQDESSASASVKSDTPVVFVVLDEFSGLSLQGPDGRINAARFPNFAALARDSTWYRNATTVADQTVAGRAGDPERHRAEQRQAADRERLPGQPVHAAGQRLPPGRARVGLAPVPRLALRAPARADSRPGCAHWGGTSGRSRCAGSSPTTWPTVSPP